MQRIKTEASRLPALLAGATSTTLIALLIFPLLFGGMIGAAHPDETSFSIPVLMIGFFYSTISNPQIYIDALHTITFDWHAVPTEDMPGYLSLYDIYIPFFFSIAIGLVTTKAVATRLDGSITSKLRTVTKYALPAAGAYVIATVITSITFVWLSYSSITPFSPQELGMGSIQEAYQEILTTPLESLLEVLMVAILLPVADYSQYDYTFVEIAVPFYTSLALGVAVAAVGLYALYKR